MKPMSKQERVKSVSDRERDRSNVKEFITAIAESEGISTWENNDLSLFIGRKVKPDTMTQEDILDYINRYRASTKTNKHGIRIIDNPQQLEGYAIDSDFGHVHGNFFRAKTQGDSGWSTIVEIKDDGYFETFHQIFYNDDGKDEILATIETAIGTPIKRISGDCAVVRTSTQVWAES